MMFSIFLVLSGFATTAASSSSSSLSVGDGNKGAPKTVIPMDNPAILYSPFNWHVTGDRAKTINPGAYFKVVFSGATCILSTDTSESLGPYSQFYASVDGSPFTQYSLMPGNPTFNIPVGISTSKEHLLEVVIKSTTETKPRWGPQNTAVIFDAIILDPASTLMAPIRKPYNVLIYGDSITEGVRANGYQGIANDTDRNDATKDYSWQISKELPAEVGVVAFGASGFSHNGSGLVPILTESYNQLWAGQPRSFSDPVPDMVIYNEGTNDGGKFDISIPFTQVVQSINKMAPKAVQILLLPFNGCHEQHILTTVKNVNNPKVVFGNTTGWFNPAFGSDGLHPYGMAHLSYISPLLTRMCSQYL